jgi:hypothetical protein
VCPGPARKPRRAEETDRAHWPRAKSARAAGLPVRQEEAGSLAGMQRSGVGPEGGTVERGHAQGWAAGPAGRKNRGGARGKKRLTGGTGLAEGERKRGCSGQRGTGLGACWAVRGPRGEGKGERGGPRGRERER